MSFWMRSFRVYTLLEVKWTTSFAVIAYVVLVLPLILGELFIACLVALTHIRQT